MNSRIEAYRAYQHPMPVQETGYSIYRGWRLSRCEFTGDWTGTGPNYDASYEGPEDGWVDNGQQLRAKTLPLLKAEIEGFDCRWCHGSGWIEDGGEANACHCGLGDARLAR